MPALRSPLRAPLRALLLVVALALALVACTSGASPSPSGSPGVASPSFAVSPGSSPSAPASPSPGASSGRSAGSVATAEEAVALVLAQDRRFAGIGPLDPNMIGQSAWYTVDPASDGWTVVVTMGWGDCPSGCIEKHVWTYTVTTTGTVTLMAETGPSVPPDAVPTR